METLVFALKDINEQVKSIMIDESIPTDVKFNIIIGEPASAIFKDVHKLYFELNIEPESYYSNNKEDHIQQFSNNLNNITLKLQKIFLSELQNPDLSYLKKLIDYVKRITHSDLDDKMKYELIFSKNISDKISFLFDRLNIQFDYYDPDTSYEEDVLAFHYALQEQLEKM